MQKRWRYILYILVLLIYYSWLHLSPALFSNSTNTSDNKITITGHRGAAGYAPENTLASVQKALDLGVDRIEIDVHQSKDSVVVVLHDESVNRTTNGEGIIAEMNYNEIRQLDAGSYFDQKFNREKIPSLEEVFQLVNGKCDLLIEFKNGNDHYPRIEEHVIELIQKYEALDWCIVHSFNTKVLVRMHHKLPSLRLHKLFIVQFRFTPIYYDLSFENFDPNDYPYIEEYSINEYFANREIIGRLQGMGKKVNVWTLNDPKKIEAYKSLGIDGIISDYPDLIQQ